jgi:hypothetical protein
MNLTKPAVGNRPPPPSKSHPNVWNYLPGETEKERNERVKEEEEEAKHNHNEAKAAYRDFKARMASASLRTKDLSTQEKRSLQKLITNYNYTGNKLSKFDPTFHFQEMFPFARDNWKPSGKPIPKSMIPRTADIKEEKEKEFEEMSNGLRELKIFIDEKFRNGEEPFNPESAERVELLINQLNNFYRDNYKIEFEPFEYVSFDLDDGCLETIKKYYFNPPMGQIRDERERKNRIEEQSKLENCWKHIMNMLIKSQEEIQKAISQSGAGRRRYKKQSKRKKNTKKIRTNKKNSKKQKSKVASKKKQKPKTKKNNKRRPKSTLKI